MCNNNQRHSEDLVMMDLLRKLYSLNEEEYELAFETDFIWQLPYESIKEFLKPIILVFNATFGLEETIGFVKYYYDNQSEYPEEYQLTETQKKLIEMVVKEELTRGEFCSSCNGLINDSKPSESFIDVNTTKRTEFMVEKAQIFIEKIALQDPSLPKEYKLTKERSFDEQLERIVRKEYSLIKVLL
mgnify:CR=1 FL=1